MAKATGSVATQGNLQRVATFSPKESSRLKHITVRTSSPLSLSKRAAVGWLDVWLTTHRGRRTEHLAPCLCGHLSLESDIESADRLLLKFSQERWAHEDAARLEWAARSVAANGIAVDNYSSVEMPNLYSPMELVDRAEAERMMAAWLSDSMLLRGPFKFHWKPTSQIVHAVVPGGRATLRAS